MKLRRRDLSRADQAGNDGMGFNDAERREAVTGGGIGQKGIDLGGAQLGAVVLDGGASVVEMVRPSWPPGF